MNTVSLGDYIFLQGHGFVEFVTLRSIQGMEPFSALKVAVMRSIQNAQHQRMFGTGANLKMSLKM